MGRGDEKAPYFFVLNEGAGAVAKQDDVKAHKKTNLGRIGEF